MNAEALKKACELTLLFHSGSPWGDDKKQHWANLLTELLGPAIERKPGSCKYVSGFPCNEATTKNLCDAIRAALAKP